MIILLALLLVAVAGLLVAVALLEGGDAVVVDVFDRQIDTQLWGVFLGGVVAGVILLAGLITLVVGIRRLRARREEIEYLRRKVAQQERADRAGSDDAGQADSTRDWLDSDRSHGIDPVSGRADQAEQAPGAPATWVPRS